MSTLTKEWLLKTIAELEEERDAVPGAVNEDAAMVLAAMKLALASLEAEKNAEPVAKVETVGVCWYADNGVPRKPAVGTELYTVPPAPVSVPDEVYAELYQLREEVKGPGGFNTWRDAATAEKVLRLSMERDALRYRFLRDKDAFGDENEPGLASWDDLAEMGYNEFDAAVDARINDSDIPKYSITQSHMVENDVAASEKNVPNERYKQISDIDYLGAMAAFHSDEWHKMGPITGYMHGWNACRAAMLQGADTELQRKSSIHDALCEKYNVESLSDFVEWQGNHIAELEAAPPAPVGEGETAVMPDYPGYVMTQRECYQAGVKVGMERSAPVLQVWYGAMPETNGKTNWTAILHRKGDHLWEGITIDRSEYPDRVRYEA
ncbi:hypothetical protein ACWY7B_004973, partial [Enterobacter hormaechei]